MQIAALKKEIYEKAVSLGIKEITLHFSGGNDEGYLNVSMTPYNHDFADEVEAWAWEVYSYSGAGDGSDYGDDVTYDIANKRASVQEWYTARREGEVMEQDFADLRSETEDNS
jgi:hypothetical protein